MLRLLDRIGRWLGLAATLAALTLALGCNGEDPDPCDPDCPPTTENPSGD